IIGAGNQAGGADAAHLLKPALARGELRTIAATTWSEYKQYFERDAALERRFQMVKVDEPDDETACLMLRGLKSRYAEHHNVHITDDAVRAAVTLSRRYLTGRQLPDKAVDLLDTASARVRMSLDTVPEQIVRLKAQLTALALEEQALLEDIAAGSNHHGDRLSVIEQLRADLDARIADLQAAVLLASAPQGIALTSGEHLQLTSTQNTMLTAGKHLDMGAMKNISMSAENELGLFAHKAGARMIANLGDVEMHSRHNTLDMSAQNAMTITSTDDEIVISTPKALTVNGGGSYLKLSDSGIEHGSKGDLTMKVGEYLVPGSGADLPFSAPDFNSTEIADFFF
ncbi:DUF2345 domain-containing protein, partial [Hafnia alvei]|uniref:DUF2345 domain-containing protein n=1 Tax=Hafnia alvei TaxID=569 RepID=UPI001455F82A